MVYVNVLLEAKQSITNLGFPEIISTLFYEKYGKNAPTLARWYKEYTAIGYQDNKNWWNETSHSFQKPSASQLTKYYQATKAFATGALSVQDYNKVRDRLDLPDYDPVSRDVDEILRDTKQELVDVFFKEAFFTRNLIKALTAGQTTIQAYAKLPFLQANQKYEEKSVFVDKAPIKTYPNKWKWIDAGDKCDLIGSQMKNCGSTGVMSGDQNRTMLTLVDPHNNPHVVATYSPNEKRLSGVEGQASTSIKLEYTDYVLDLIKFLGVEFDAFNEKSKPLKLKYMLKPKSLVQIPGKSDFNEFFEVELSSGDSYYTEGYQLVSKPMVDALVLEPQPTTLFDKLTKVFNYQFKNDIIHDNPGFKYLMLQQVMSGVNEARTRAFIRKLVKEVVRSSGRPGGS